MGGAANILEWIVPPVAIAHETFAAAGRALGADKNFLAAPGSRNAARASTPTAPTTRPGMTDAEREREARVAASQRKKDYQDLGRSSTILTGGQGLGGSGVGVQKTLLGL